MLRKLQLLVPGFLRKVDRYLLLHHPVIWATRIHYVAFYTLLAYGLFFLSAFALRPASLPHIELRMGLMFIPVLGALGIWAYGVYHSKVEGGFGLLSGAKEGLSHLLYVAGFLMLTSLPWVYAYTLTLGVQKALPQEELREDILALEMGRFYFSFPNGGTGFQYFHLPHGYDNPEAERHGLGLPQDPLGPESIQGIIDPQLAEQVIRDYQKTLFKFGAPLPAFTPSEVLLAWEADTRLAWDPGGEFSRKVAQNLMTAVRAHSLDYVFFRSEFVHFFIFLLLLGGLAFLVYVKVSFRQFLIAAALGMVVLIGMLIVTAVINYLAIRYSELHIPHLGEVAFSLLFILTFCAMAWQAYFAKPDSGKPVVLAMATMMTSFLPLALYTAWYYLSESSLTGYSQEDLFRQLFVFPALLSFAVWHFLYRPRFRQLFAMPRKA